jgi:hypothetical protein
MHCYLPVTPRNAKVNAEGMTAESGTRATAHERRTTMTKTRDDLTISEALRDPLIAMVLRADGVKLEDFKQLLETAARKREPRSNSVGNMIGALANRANLPAMPCFG